MSTPPLVRSGYRAITTASHGVMGGGGGVTSGDDVIVRNVTKPNLWNAVARMCSVNRTGFH